MSSALQEEEDVALAQAHAIPTDEPAVSPVGRARLWIARHRRLALIVGGVVALLVVAFYLMDASTHEETDDAYVTGHLHYVSARISEMVTDVLAQDNQLVHQGDVLVRLDPLQYGALTMAAKANLGKAQKDLERQEPLLQTHAVVPQDVDATRNTRDVNDAEFQLAELQLSYTTVHAPATGYIGRRNVEVGNRVTAGQTLMVVVEPDLWVVANFKETQLTHMRRGQLVRITIDSVPGRTFPGKVDSFSPATGNAFALLPADNSTGNFTKVVQRVPVKIVFDPGATRGYQDRIRAGESVVVKVALTEPRPEQQGAAHQP